MIVLPQLVWYKIVIIMINLDPFEEKTQYYKIFFIDGILLMWIHYTKLRQGKLIWNISRGMRLKFIIQEPCMRILNLGTRDPEIWVQWKK